MTRQRRYRSRQGVVYGPYQPRDGVRSSGGMLIGQALGLIVVVAAVAVLAVGALSLIGGDDGVAVASPSPTSAAASLPTATASPAPRTPTPPTAAASPTIAVPGASFTPGASLEPLPSASAGATPFALEVRVGPGFVTFGTQRNSSLRITNPGTEFGLDERVLWSAALSEPTDTWLLASSVYKLDLASGSERLVDERGERARVAGAELVSSSLVPRRRLDGPGIYVMRYTRGSQLLSEGFFRVTGN